MPHGIVFIVPYSNDEHDYSENYHDNPEPLPNDGSSAKLGYLGALLNLGPTFI